ncbi:hypothetical protein LCGC14_2367360, partial [marine sediment metagenome]
FEKTIQDVLAGKFDSGPVEIEVKEALSFKKWQNFKNPFAYGETNAEVFGALENQKQHYKWYAEDHAMRSAASPAAQIDAAETVITGQEVLLEESNRRQAARYEELLKLVEQGDELAAQEIQEMIERLHNMVTTSSPCQRRVSRRPINRLHHPLPWILALPRSRNLPRASYRLPLRVRPLIALRSQALLVEVAMHLFSFLHPLLPYPFRLWHCL